MSYKLIKDEHLTDIADAIRDKNKTEDVYKPKEMAEAIANIKGLDEIEPNLHFSGVLDYWLAGGKWDWFIQQYGDKITTSNVEDTYAMMRGSKLEEIPFELNLNGSGGYYGYEAMFDEANNLKVLPVVKSNPKTDYIDFDGFCSHCWNLNCPITEEWFDWVDWDRVHNEGRIYGFTNMFIGCHSLRTIDENLMKKLYNPIKNGTGWLGLHGCYTLDEVRGYPLPPLEYSATNNRLDYLYRIKDFIFETDENNNPLVRNYSEKHMVFYTGMGYCTDNATNITRYNSGITADKEVKDDATYQALKNDPDWFTCKIEYSRYNRGSAVRTINSLPDTSAYVAEKGKGNTISFKGASGSLTDEGAINTMTEEEIAVATAKGWTVSYV